MLKFIDSLRQQYGNKNASGMRTARLLTVSRSIRRGMYPSMHWAEGRVCIQACIGRGVYPSMHWAGGRCDRHPPCGQTDTCENIIFTNFVCGR